MAKSKKPAGASGSDKKIAKKKESPQKPVSYDVAKMQGVAEALRGIAGEIDAFVQDMKESGIDSLMVREGMVLRSKKALENFCDKALEKIRKAKRTKTR